MGFSKRLKKKLIREKASKEKELQKESGKARSKSSFQPSSNATIRSRDIRNDGNATHGRAKSYSSDAGSAPRTKVKRFSKKKIKLEQKTKKKAEQKGTSPSSAILPNQSTKKSSKRKNQNKASRQKIQKSTSQNSSPSDSSVYINGNSPKKKEKPTRKPSRLLSLKSVLKKLAPDADPSKPPPDFEQLLPSLGDDLISAAETIRRLLSTLKTGVSFDSANPIVAEYSPNKSKGFLGEVDGEWRVDGVRGESTKELLGEMMEAFLPINVSEQDREALLGKGYWISVGIRWHGKAEFDKKTGEWMMTEKDAKYGSTFDDKEGMFDINSHYRSMESSAKIHSAFSTLMLKDSRHKESMIQQIEKDFKKKVGQVYVRIHWNPANVQPKRYRDS